jgi:hypothetical protein
MYMYIYEMQVPLYGIPACVTDMCVQMLASHSFVWESLNLPVANLS